mmetsp:Transcript_14693/g.10594  ORF Transcript_14693/g.10594 Transcript_14693/m.10594 type:complete len:252 (-) Transcript_14693:706-1461(-)
MSTLVASGVLHVMLPILLVALALILGSALRVFARTLTTTEELLLLHIAPGLSWLLELLPRRHLREDLRWSLRNCSSTSDGLHLLDLNLSLGFLFVFLTEPLVLLVNIQNQLLSMSACYLVLIVVSGADAEVEGLVGLLLPRALFKSRPLASETKLDDFLELVVAGALATDFDNSLHVATLGPNEPPSHLELLVIINLDVKTTRVLHVLFLGLKSCLLGAAHVGCASIELLGSRGRRAFLVWLSVNILVRKL